MKSKKECPEYINPALANLVTPISDLTPDTANARLHDEDNIRAIMASLKRFGQRAPIVVQKNGMVVRAGNGRLEAARRLGWDKIAAIVVDEDNMNATAFAIADNRSAELATWDQGVLTEMLKELVNFDQDLAFDTGFNEAYIESILAKPIVSDWDNEPAEQIEDDKKKTKDDAAKGDWQPTVGRIVLNYDDETYARTLDLIAIAIERGLAKDVSDLFYQLLKERLESSESLPSESSEVGGKTAVD